LHLFLKLGEGRCVGGLVLLEELQHFLDALGVELLANAVQVLALVGPEAELLHGARILAVLESVLGVLLENVFNLTAPLNDRVLQNKRLVLRRGLFR